MHGPLPSRFPSRRVRSVSPSRSSGTASRSREIGKAKSRSATTSRRASEVGAHGDARGGAMRVLRAAAVGMVLLAFITVGPTPSSAELKVNLGGYIKLDPEYQSNITNEGKFRVDPGPASVAFTEGPNKDRVKARNDEFLIEARESRFHLSITDEVGATKLKGFIQGDFFGGRDDDSNSLVSNSSLFRLRHAWASGETQFGPGSLTVLAGQTWSAFMNIDVAAWDLVDFNGPAGQLFARQPQLRLTYAIPYGKGTSLNIIGAVQAQSVNFETTDLNAVPLTKSSLTAAGVSPARQEGENVPAFVGKLQWISEYLKAEAGAIYSKAKGIAPNGKRQEANAYGLQASVTAPLGPFSINLHWDWLSGMNREANGDYADAASPRVGGHFARPQARRHGGLCPSPRSPASPPSCCSSWPPVALPHPDRRPRPPNAGCSSRTRAIALRAASGSICGSKRTRFRRRSRPSSSERRWPSRRPPRCRGMLRRRATAPSAPSRGASMLRRTPSRSPPRRPRPRGDLPSPSRAPTRGPAEPRRLLPLHLSPPRPAPL